LKLVKSKYLTLFGLTKNPSPVTFTCKGLRQANPSNT